MKRTNNAGSVIFLILIAVALFAALTYAVMRGGSGNTGMSKEKSTIAATEIMAYTTAVEQHLNRMMGMDGVSESDLDPGYTVKLVNGSTTSNYGGNANCTVDKCRIFVDKNGKLQTQYFDQYAPNRPAAWGTGLPVMGSIDFAVVNVSGVGTAAPELALRVKGISIEVCNAIHRKLGLAEDTDAIESGAATQFYSAGAATELAGSTSAAEVVGVSDTSFAGKTAFCHFNSTDGYATFYRVVLAR